MRRQGKEIQGMQHKAMQGILWDGKAWNARKGKAWDEKKRHRIERKGKACHDMEGQDKERQGMERQ